ncbi:radical SAM family heme chaperone HemW [Alkalibacillus aidingensis]|uniref:radical SAM family heme chaperone HemW n=1 Tax=Alkalibacillus aidingensis TaxID=2747607 RepID=UPI001660C3B4|nr:radical SAM family heme chaperone HemW [Alkalibacillus aidingensis]
MNVTAVYIHIPFCHEICHYCDFAKMYYHEAIADQYLESLNQEMGMYVENKPIAVRTVYIGGGTPTSLNPKQLERLLETISTYINIDQVEEFTIEANPGEFVEDHVKVMKAYGINRVSLGVQVLDNDYLKQLNRHHTVEDVNQSVKLLQEYDLTNISMDFIYSLPGQTLDHFKNTLKQAIAYGLPHYSSYALQIEPKTVFYMRYQKGQLHKPVEEVEAKMFTTLIDVMEENGLSHYEISNFAKPGFESQHNLTYWANVPYYAFGAGAHGYLDGYRYVNLRPVNHYNDRVIKGEKPILHQEQVTLKEKVEEELFLGLRRRSGVSNCHFQEKFGFSMYEIYQDTIDYLLKKDWVYVKEDTVAMTRNGMMFGNEVFSEFLIDDHIWESKLSIDSHKGV